MTGRKPHPAHPARPHDLPASFRRMRLELAREPGHPAGSAVIGYIVYAPLDAGDRIDPEVWKENRDACRVVRFRPGEEDDVGHLIRRPGGSWAFQIGRAHV